MDTSKKDSVFGKPSLSSHSGGFLIKGITYEGCTDFKI